MAARTVVICEGQTFEGIDLLADHYKIHPSTVARRLRNGWTPEQSVGIHPRQRLGHGTEVEYRGQTYRTIKDACIALGLDDHVIRARIKRGYSLIDALEGSLSERSGNSNGEVNFRQEIFPSLSALARKYGQKGSNVKRRMARGWTLEQALMLEEAPPRFRNFEGHARSHKWKEATSVEGLIEPVPDAGGFKLYLVTNTHNDKVYVGITIGPLENRLRQHFAAARRGRKSAFTNAIKKYGEEAFSIQLIRNDAQSFKELQEQEIAEIEVRDSIKLGYNTAAGGALGTSKNITVDGKTFPSRSQAAEFYGIDPTVFNLRLERLKWTPEEAAGLIEKTWKGKSIPVVVQGVQYPSFNAACNSLGLDEKMTKAARHLWKTKGASVEEAIERVRTSG